MNMLSKNLNTLLDEKIMVLFNTLLNSMWSKYKWLLIVKLAIFNVQPMILQYVDVLLKFSYSKSQW